MTIAAHGWAPRRLLWFNPHILLRIKNAQTRMVLLAVIASKDPQFALVERRCMVLDLGSTTYDRTKHGLRGDRLICAPVLGGTADLVVSSVG